jgi:hypothetical protein
MGDRVFKAIPHWTVEDQAAWESSKREWFSHFDQYKKPESERLKGSAGLQWLRGYNPSDYRDGARLPPTGREIVETEARIQQIESRVEAHQEPLAYPLLPYYQLLQSSVPPEIQLLAAARGVYLLDYGIDLVPRGGEKFVWLEFNLTYPPSSESLTFALAPDTELEARAEDNVQATLGLDPHLNFRIMDVPLGAGASAGGGVKAGLDTNFLVKWQYCALRAKVIATGVQSRRAVWRIERDDLVGSIAFRVVLLAPKRAKRLVIEVNGGYAVKKSNHSLEADS